MIVFSISGSAKSARSRAARRRRVVPAVRSRIPGARRARSAGSRSASGATAGGPGKVTIHLSHTGFTPIRSREAMAEALQQALHPISLAVSVEYRLGAPP
jgi:hypothetical protein